MAGWASRHGGQKRGGGGGGGRGINPRLAQQQMGLELLRRRGGFSAGSGSTSTDLLQQHQQQVQWMSARSGGWQPNGVVPSWMLSRGLEGGGPPLHFGGAGGEASMLGGVGFGGGKTGGELDGYGMLQTQQVEIDGKLHTMFCLPADSPPRLNLGLHGASFAPALGFTAFDYNAAARVPERGILGGGPSDSRWARPRSPRRTLPTLVPHLSPRRSRSPYRHRRLSPARLGNPGTFSRRSPSRHFRGRSPRDESPRSPRHRGNPPLLQRHEQGLLPRPPLLSFEPHLLPNPIGQQLLSRQLLDSMSPRREAGMLRHDALSSRHDYLVRGGRDLVSPTGRDYLRRSSPDVVRSSYRFTDSVRNGRGILGAAAGTAPRERLRERSRERNRERHKQDVDVRKHALPLEEAIPAKRTKVADGSRREGEQNAKGESLEDKGKSEDFKAKVDKSQAHYSRMLKEDSVRRKKYEDAKNGRAQKLECLVCGSKNFSDLVSLVTHASQGTEWRKRADHQGFHKALCELLGWNPLASPETKRGWSPPGKATDDQE